MILFQLVRCAKFSQPIPAHAHFFCSIQFRAIALGQIDYARTPAVIADGRATRTHDIRTLDKVSATGQVRLIPPHFVTVTLHA
jgi:hypothetical protein